MLERTSEVRWMRFCLRWSVAVLLLLAAGPSVQAKDWIAVAGSIRDVETGKPIPGLVVEVGYLKGWWRFWSPITHGVAKVRAGDDGKFWVSARVGRVTEIRVYDPSHCWSPGVHVALRKKLQDSLVFNLMKTQNFGSYPHCRRVHQRVAGTGRDEPAGSEAPP